MIPAEDLIPGLRERLKRPLPGHGGFLEIGGYKRPDLAAVLALDPPPRESAVLILLHPVHGVWHTLLMLRPVYVGVHSAQVSFPGGKREPEDPDLHATAIREFHEETGAPPADIEVLGDLTRVYIPPSRMLVTPVVAWAPDIGPFTPDPREVQALIPAVLDELLFGDILRRTRKFVQVLGGEVEVPYWDIGGHMVWGATALMIAELRALMADLSPGR